MNAFKLRRFNALVILQCVRWYGKYAISYRQLEEMMAEGGVAVDHTSYGRNWVNKATRISHPWRANCSSAR